MEHISNYDSEDGEDEKSALFTSGEALTSPFAELGYLWTPLRGKWKKEEIRGWRLAELDDIEAIEELMHRPDNKAASLFNKDGIEYLIEKSYFPIVQFDNRGRVVSFIAYNCYPNIPSVPPFCWVEWIQGKYRLIDANSRNTLFIHYMVWDSRYSTGCLRLLLETPFMEFAHLRYIILIKPPRSEMLLPYHLTDGENELRSLQSINVCLREAFIHRLHIREAMGEDSDLLMSLFRAKNLFCFEKIYGEYFFAELKQFPGATHRHMLVCENEGNAAGVMSINLDLDLEVLNEEFNLIPFHGLRKVNAGESTPRKFESVDLNNPVIDKLDILSTRYLSLQHILLASVESSMVELKMDSSSSSSESVYGIEVPILSESELHSTQSLDKLQDAGLSKSTESLIAVEARAITSNFDVKADRDELNMAMPSGQNVGIPRYHGPSNAFAIELFAVDNDIIDERLSIDFVEAAFALAPNREYCIIMIPTYVFPFPLLNHFVRVSHRESKQLKQELYVCHKSYFSSSISVRPVEQSDSVELQNFLCGMYGASAIRADFEASFMPGSADKAFALTVEKTIVGVALLRFQSGLDELAARFDTAEFSTLDLHSIENLSVLRHLLVNPSHHGFARFFLMDMMRLSGVTCLFYLYYHEDKLNGSIVSVLGDLVPLKPKSTVRCQRDSVSSKTCISNGINLEVPFALFLTNSRLCSRTRLNMNKIIVVVGASTTAFSFFESILFGSSRRDLCYNNLIWVSAHGTGEELLFSEVAELMFPIRSRFHRNYRAMLSLKAHVHFITGVMTGINRDKKYVIINDIDVVQYDILILTVGLQYLKPTPEVSKKKKECERNNVLSSLSRYLKTACAKNTTESFHPINMFIINTYSEAESALLALHSVTRAVKFRGTDKKIIVYGHNIRVFLVMQSLLKLGIPGCMIAFVEPFPSREVSITVFGDVAIDKEVINSLRRCEIQYYPGYFLYDWTLNAPNRIATITFHSFNSQITLQCLLFIPLVQKLVSDVNFNAFNRAGLVYNGKLVIDSNFRTNDKSIFAAGSFTKYSSRYRSPEQAHQFYNSAEIGEKLAEFIQREMTCWKEQEDEEEEEDDSGRGCTGKSCSVKLLPTFQKPIMIYCQLPGDIYYFSVRSPGKPVDFGTDFHHFGLSDILITGDCRAEGSGRYFRLHLDRAGCVRYIMCFSRTEIDYMNLCSLYGLHEKLLNNLLMRYDCGLITDLFDYFREPWADAIYHEDFHMLSRSNMRALNEEKLSGKMETIADGIAYVIRNIKEYPLPHPVMLKIELEYRSSPALVIIQQNVIEFLYYFKEELKRYAPSMSREPIMYDDQRCAKKGTKIG